MLISDANADKAAEHILGVSCKPLKTFPDDRGFFREVIRETDPFFDADFAQWSHSKMAKNTVKAWHFHHKQIDWWYCGVGLINAVLIDNREESPTCGNKLEFMLGDPEEHPEAFSAVVKIPQGVLHALKVYSNFAHLFYVTSQVYNPKDEGRLAFNSEKIGYDWGNEDELIVADNDRRDFIPPYERPLAK